MYSPFSFMEAGNKARRVGATNMNERSSRSHTIFRLKVESTNRVNEDDTVMEGEEDEGKPRLIFFYMSLRSMRIYLQVSKLPSRN